MGDTGYLRAIYVGRLCNVYAMRMYQMGKVSGALGTARNIPTHSCERSASDVRAGGHSWNLDRVNNGAGDDKRVTAMSRGDNECARKD